MKIRTQKVITVYTIEITWDDFVEAFDLWNSSPLKDVGHYKGAFDCGVDPREEGSNTAMRNLFKKMQFHKAGTPTVAWIVEQYLNFDDVKNYGSYSERAEAHVCEVSNYGDQIN